MDKVKRFSISFFIIFVMGILFTTLFYNWTLVKSGAALTAYSLPMQRIISWAAISLIIAFMRTRRGE
jgi:small-conductance mechanosensitive channel